MWVPGIALVSVGSMRSLERLWGVAGTAAGRHELCAPLSYLAGRRTVRARDCAADLVHIDRFGSSGLRRHRSPSVAAMRGARANGGGARDPSVAVRSSAARWHCAGSAWACCFQPYRLADRFRMDHGDLAAVSGPPRTASGARCHRAPVVVGSPIRPATRPRCFDHRQ